MPDNTPPGRFAKSRTDSKEREKAVKKYLDKQKPEVQSELFDLAGSGHGIEGDYTLCERLVTEPAEVKSLTFMVNALNVYEIKAELSVNTDGIKQSVEVGLKPGLNEFKERVKIPKNSVVRVRVFNADPFKAHSIYFSTKLYQPLK